MERIFYPYHYGLIRKIGGFVRPPAVSNGMEFARDQLVPAAISAVPDFLHPSFPHPVADWLHDTHEAPGTWPNPHPGRVPTAHAGQRLRRFAELGRSSPPLHNTSESPAVLRGQPR